MRALSAHCYAGVYGYTLELLPQDEGRKPPSKSDLEAAEPYIPRDGSEATDRLFAKIE